MKKLFTLIAFLMVVMGAKAEWVMIHRVDYSAFTGFPAYVMGYVPEWVDGVMTDVGGNYRHATDAEMEGNGALTEGEEVVGTVTKNDGTVYNKIYTGGTWHQYFITNGNFPTELDGAYTLKAMARASEPVSVPVQMRWSWGADPVTSTLNIGTEWQEYECDFTGVQGTACDIIAQPNTAATIEWKYIEVWQNKKETRPVEWRDLLHDETGAYVDGVVNQLAKPFDLEINRPVDDTENAEAIYALVKKAPSKDENGELVYYFESPAVDKAAYDGQKNTKGEEITNNYAWANQLFITSPEVIKKGETIRISFDYKADKPATTNTQCHGRPSAYHYWQAIGDVAFSTEWQTKEATLEVSADQAGTEGMYSLAFNLNPDNTDANTWCLKNIKMEKMMLDEGFFVASQNTSNGIQYDYDNATELVYDEAEGALVAVVGEKGKENTWINEIMISTMRGQDQSFKANTIKPAYVKNDAEDWAAYQPSTNYKIKLPAAGVWSIRIIEDEDVPGTGYISFVKLEGEEEKEPVVIVANPTEVVINAVEREATSAEAEGGTGQPWDNQFIIIANRPLEKGEKTVIEFDYVADKAATTNTQLGQYGNPGGYIHWNCLGDVNFTTEEQHFTKAYEVSASANEQNPEALAGGITFNMAVIKEANVYRIKNIIWKLEDGSESLISMTDGSNFYIKTGAGTAPQNMSDGIEEIVLDKPVSNAVYNLAGQRVANSYKGVAIKNGQKFIVK